MWRLLSLLSNVTGQDVYALYSGQRLKGLLLRHKIKFKTKVNQIK